MAGQVQQRRETEEQRRRDAEADEEGHHRRVDREHHPRRHAHVASEDLGQPDAADGHRETGEAARASQEEALHRQLPDDLPPGGAQREPDRELVRTLRRPRNQEVGDVGARDEEDDRHGAGQRQVDQPDVRAGRPVVERLHDGADVLVRGGMLRPELLGDGAYLGPGLLDCRAGTQASDGGQRAEVTAIEDLGRAERLPEVRPERETDPFGHHADDGRGLAVDAHDAADDPRVSPVAVAPHVKGEDHRSVGAAPAVRGSEVAPQQDRLAEEAERVRRDERAVPRLRSVLAAAQAHPAVDRERGEAAQRGGAAPVVLEIGERHVLVRVTGVAPRRDVDQATGALVGQAADEDGVNHREDRHVEADAQPQRRGRQGHEGAVPREAADRVAQVARDALDPPRPTRVAAQLLDLVETAEFESRAAPRLVLGQAGPHVLGHLPLDMVAQLAVQLALQPITVPESPPPAHRASPPAVPRIRPTASASRAQLSVCSCSRARPFGVSR